MILKAKLDIAHLSEDDYLDLLGDLQGGLWMPYIVSITMGREEVEFEIKVETDRADISAHMARLESELAELHEVLAVLAETRNEANSREMRSP